MSFTKTLSVLTVLAACLVSLPAAGDPPRAEHVATVRTPLSPTELLQALREGHLKVFGKLPSKNRLAMAWGQVAFENGAGKWSFNHNLGNVGAVTADQPTWFNKGDQHWYRAFFTFEDGAAAYWEVIKRCAPALARFDTGNPREAAVWLKRCNYFEATLEEYTPGFSSLFYTAINKIIPEEERDQERRTQELLAAIKRSIDASPPAAPVAHRGGSILLEPLFDIAFSDRD